MKVYGIPKEVAYPEPDYANYDFDRERRREDAHRKTLKKWLKDNGYKGKRTGEIARFPMADGYACYMLADGRRSALIHLPYGDAWHYRDVEFLPKKEVLRRIDADKALAKIFSDAKKGGK